MCWFLMRFARLAHSPCVAQSTDGPAPRSHAQEVAPTPGADAMEEDDLPPPAEPTLAGQQMDVADAAGAAAAPGGGVAVPAAPKVR